MLALLSFLMFFLILRHSYKSKYRATLIVIELKKWIKNTYIYEILFDSKFGIDCFSLKSFSQILAKI
jgi:hypothetical protein